MCSSVTFLFLFFQTLSSRNISHGIQCPPSMSPMPASQLVPFPSQLVPNGHGHSGHGHGGHGHGGQGHGGHGHGGYGHDGHGHGLASQNLLHETCFTKLASTKLASRNLLHETCFTKLASRYLLQLLLQPHTQIQIHIQVQIQIKIQTRSYLELLPSASVAATSNF